jgi:hypothetical protein
MVFTQAVRWITGPGQADQPYFREWRRSICKCGTWTDIFGEECRLRVFENRVLRKIEKEEVTGEWRKLHNDSCVICYSSPNIIRVIK